MAIKIPVIAIFDIGKTNKKIFLFDEQYHIVWEKNTHLTETTDEDGFPCEDLNALTDWVSSAFGEICSLPEFEIKAVNFSGYGATLVYLNRELEPIGSICNYLKPFPESLQKKFYDTYGGEIALSTQTASPPLGSQNSGLQLYRTKYEKPGVFNRIHCALHLPQYLSFILSKKIYSDLTSIGCHTLLWNFQKSNYHDWVTREGLSEKFAPTVPCDTINEISLENKRIKVGIGLHDSSAALVPYLQSFQENFILLSTGTWCISLNPFNHHPLTETELRKDCLFYLSVNGSPVKASRLFAGQEHEQQAKRIAEHFHVPEDFYKAVSFDQDYCKSNLSNSAEEIILSNGLNPSAFGNRQLSEFPASTQAYHQLIIDLSRLQRKSTELIMNKETQLFVDGGFSSNSIYMSVLAMVFPEIKIHSATVPQASALGAALVLHKHWTNRPAPENFIEMKSY